MKKITLKALAKKIELENAAFEKMTQAEKRVVIAKDCLARIEIKQIVPNFQRFCRINSLYDAENISIKETINTVNKEICTACAKGSLFMSYVGRVNNYQFSEIDGGNGVDDSEHVKLLELFSLEQLALIETVFEGDQYIHKDETHEYIRLDFEKIKAFRIEHNNVFEESKSTQLLIAICENMIANNGTFIL